MEASGESYRVQWSIANIILATLRTASLFLFLLIIVDTRQLWLPLSFPLSSWNALLAFLFFFGASVASAIGLCNRNTISRNRERVLAQLTELLAVGVHSSFEICCSTAIFAVAFELGLAPPFPAYVVDTPLASFPVSLISLAPFATEFFMNNLEVRLDQYPSSAMWFLLYLMLIWPLVYDGQLPGWPNNYLQTANSLCFFQYFILLLLHIFCFLFFYIIYKAKVLLVLQLASFGQCARQHSSDTSSTSGSGGTLSVTHTPGSGFGSGSAFDMSSPYPEFATLYSPTSFSYSSASKDSVGLAGGSGSRIEDPYVSETTGSSALYFSAP